MALGDVIDDSDVLLEKSCNCDDVEVARVDESFELILLGGLGNPPINEESAVIE